MGIFSPPYTSESEVAILVKKAMSPPGNMPSTTVTSASASIGAHMTAVGSFFSSVATSKSAPGKKPRMEMVSS